MQSPSDSLLRYRAWRGTFRPPVFASIAMARWSFQLLLRRKLFWLLYSLSLMIFLFFFYGQYLVIWIQTQTASQTVMIGALPVRVGELTKFLDKLNLNGSPHTFGNFIWFEGYIATIILAVSGALLIGNDFHHGSLAFYLSKPINRWHYLAGKCLGVCTIVQLMTTLPALILYFQAGLLYDWKTYYIDNFILLIGVITYGLMIGVVLSLVLVASAIWVRRTVPLIMLWCGIMVMGRVLATFLVEGQHFHANWRLVDLWNNLYLVGLWLMQADRDPKLLGMSAVPEVWKAGLVLVGVSAICTVFLRSRIRAIEIVK